MLCVSTSDEVGFVVKTFFGNGIAQRENRRKRLVFHNHFLRCCATGFLRVADYQGNKMAVEQDLFVCEQNFVLLHRANVIATGNILGEQHDFDAGHQACGRGVAFENLGVRVG